MQLVFCFKSIHQAALGFFVSFSFFCLSTYVLTQLNLNCQIMCYFTLHCFPWILKNKNKLYINSVNCLLNQEIWPGFCCHLVMGPNPHIFLSLGLNFTSLKIQGDVSEIFKVLFRTAIWNSFNRTSPIDSHLLPLLPHQKPVSRLVDKNNISKSNSGCAAVQC